MLSIEENIIFISCCIACFTIGIIAGWKISTNRYVSNQQEPFFALRKTIPNFFDVQTKMVEDSCDEVIKQKIKEKEAKYVKRAQTIVKRNIPKINQTIKKKARHKSIGIVVFPERHNNLVRSRQQKKNDISITYKYDIVIHVPNNKVVKHIREMIEELYSSCEYEVNSYSDIDCEGRIFAGIYIDWTKNLDVSLLDKLEFISQADAFKAGVPLEDILAHDLECYQASQTDRNSL